MKKSTSSQNVDLLGNAAITTNSTRPTQVKKFVGTYNPRHLRALTALIKRSITRESLDRIVGCSNGPDLVFNLRDLGLDIPCQRVPAYDRDGERIWHGVYSLTSLDRKKIHRWLAARPKEAK